MKRGFAITVMAGMMVLTAGTTAYAGQWIQTGEVWRYLRDDGKLQAGGWEWIDGKCYYFDESGNMLAAVTTPDGYQVDGSGAWVLDGVVQTKAADERQMASLQRSSRYDDDDDYDDYDDDDYDDDDYDVDFDDEYADVYVKSGPGYDPSAGSDSGSSEDGWNKVGSRWVYYVDGRRVTDDWRKVDGEWYYFDEDGIMVTGFCTIQRAEYYFKSSGALQMDSFTLDGVRYTVNEDGAIIDEEETGSSSSSSGPGSSKYTSNTGTTFGKDPVEDDGPVKQTEFSYAYDERNQQRYYDDDDDDYDDDYDDDIDEEDEDDE